MRGTPEGRFGRGADRKDRILDTVLCMSLLELKWKWEQKSLPSLQNTHVSHRYYASSFLSSRLQPAYRTA